MKIGLIGKFQRLHDEEYIARSFEMLGHKVVRIQSDESFMLDSIFNQIMDERPDIVIYGKLNLQGDTKKFIKQLKFYDIKAVCWIFDLYIGYPREFRLNAPQFKDADILVSTDGGHNKEFLEKGINHKCVRQGIYKPECFVVDKPKIRDVAFVGSPNALYDYRQNMLDFVKANYSSFKWFGQKDTNEIRGTRLNDLYGETKVIVGDSVYSPYYWSNRVVETLGRGGFLIHPNVEGIKQEYPHLVTYEYKNFDDLKTKIDYYLAHDDEREELRKKNFEWVRDNYTMDKKCAQLISLLS